MVPAADHGDGRGRLLQPAENDGLMRTSTTPRSRRSGKSIGSNSNARPGEDSFDYYGPSPEQDEEEDGGDEEDGAGISLQELLYSSSSYHAIAKPVTITMILASLAVVLVNNDETRAEGEQAMASAYQVWTVDSSKATTNLALSLANALVMVSVICAMTFVIVLLYKFRCMKCLIGYMMLCSGTLLGVLGGNLLQAAIHIYGIPVDKFTFFFFVFNFCLVGVMAVFWGKGIPKYVTQGYLVSTSVILAWHLSYFDDWTTWSLLFMLALYDLCAVLTPCGPLKALVNLMSEDEAPEMPGLLFEAELPAEAKRPGIPRSSSSGRLSRSSSRSVNGDPQQRDSGTAPEASPNALPSSQSLLPAEGPTVNIPLAIAKVYNLKVISVPESSRKLIFPNQQQPSSLLGTPNRIVASAPLLQDHDGGGTGNGPNQNGASSSSAEVINLPENPTPTQLRAVVTVRLPPHGGRIEQVSRRGKRVYLERDRHGEPKRLLWVDRNGKVFAEMRSDDEEGPERNTIRLGLGDFIFYSVMCAKAAQYSFATFTSCYVVILAGLGGTLVLLSVYHHALPALPISIFLGVVFYLVTRAFVEPWIEAVLNKPFYV
jgi:presenilin 1